MLSLWSLLTPRPQRRCFALLDAQGQCRALREAHTPPSEAGWVEVRELRASWLGRPLPQDARLAAHPRDSRARLALAA